MRKRRLFVAIELPPQVKAELAKLKTKLARSFPHVRWERAENLHLTLKFLGSTEVAPELILASVIKKLVGVRAFTLHFGTLGVIMNKAAVVTVEVEKSEELMRLYHMVNNCLDEIGFKHERRTFHPHVTLGRIRERDTIHPLHIPQASVATPQLKVEEVILFDSRVTSPGAIHTRLGTIPLIS